MHQRTLQLKFPDNIQQSDEELKTLIAAKLYENGVLTAGQGAELAGLTKRTFLEKLGHYHVSVFSDSVADLKADMQNA
jgi:predicted HTH domain antitoxin